MSEIPLLKSEALGIRYIIYGTSRKLLGFLTMKNEGNRWLQECLSFQFLGKT